MQILAQHLYERTLFVVYRTPILPRPKSKEQLQETYNQPGTRSVELAPPTAPWIEFVLRDEQSGNPLVGIKVRIKRPDGTVVIKASDNKGSIYLNNLDEGFCEIEEIMDNDGWVFCSMEKIR